MRSSRTRIVGVGFITVLLGVVIAAHGGPRASAQGTLAPPASVTSAITVIVPDDEATLSVNEKTVEAVGPQRQFDTPPLERGSVHRYTFAVQWRPNNYTLLTRKKTVEFTAGESVLVDLAREDPSDRAEIRYVPTPHDVVGEMVRLANLTADDVVYEPGCGDARVTIAAVKAGAKRGVGIDIEPQRVAEAKANVEDAALQDRIDIRLGDALDIKDLSDATVVFLYMGDEFDALLRPILWKQLRVGSRVISHRFTMGDWTPDETVYLSLGEDSYTVHVWTITPEIKARAQDLLNSGPVGK